MDIPALISLLEDEASTPRLREWGLRDPEAGRKILASLAEQGLTLDLLVYLCDQLADRLPKVADPDAVLLALSQYIAAARSPLALVALFERDAEALPMLLRVLNLGPTWRERIVTDPEAFDLLRMTDGQPVAGPWLTDEICGELANYVDERHLMSALRRIKRRELLRIVYGDLFRHQQFDLVAEQLTFLAEALLEAAVRAARRRMQEQRQEPKWASGAELRFAAIGLGRFGGQELDYSDHLEVLFLHDALPDNDHARRQGQEYFDRLGRLIVRLLSDAHSGEVAYQIATPLRLDDQPGVTAPIDAALAYFDGFGRTWHRQAFTKARGVAGDKELADQFLKQLEPWVYRRYLSRADEIGIKALKRRVERQSLGNQETYSTHEPSLGARHIENATQFLQLLNGGDLPQVRTVGTLAAIAGLEQSAVLSVDERTLLEENYRLLRTCEHRLQVVEDRPDQAKDEHAWSAALRATDAAVARLLGSAFSDDASVPPEVDLLLDPQPADRDIETVLGRYGFHDVRAAFHHLESLASERIPFLSRRRCRYFLTSIAPQLLTVVASTPDPDFTLANLSQVSDSLGGKGVLWELLSFNPPSLNLYVRLCAASPYLSNMLTSNPGMLDELVDSLQLSQSPAIGDLQVSLAELCRGTDDSLSVLPGFKNSHHLQIGVRDILGRQQIDATHRALADVAETCLAHIVQIEYDKLVEKFGEPTIGSGPSEGKPCQPVLLALGKLAGREPNYHSSLKVAFLYEADGMTRPLSRGRREQRTTNSHLFAQLAQRVVKEASRLTPQGRLYSVELPLRPTTGAMAMSAAEFEEHFRSGAASLDQWRELCQTRTIFGTPDGQAETIRTISHLLTSRQVQPDELAQLRRTRAALEQGASPRNLKRGPGGSIDVEFIVQAWQLRYAGRYPNVIVPGTLDAIDALVHNSLLSADDAVALADAYRFLRRIESGLRLLNTDARHDLPEDEVALRKLALLIRWNEPKSLADHCQQVMAENRQRFDRLMDHSP